MNRQTSTLTGLALLCISTLSLASTSSIYIKNHGFEVNQVTQYSSDVMNWLPVGNGLLTLNATRYEYEKDLNGLQQNQLAFNTASGGIEGCGLSQVLEGVKALDNGRYSFKVAVGARNFNERFAGITLQLRLSDDTLLGSAEFGKEDIHFSSTSAPHELVDVTGTFSLHDVNNTQDLKIVILAGGGSTGGSIGRESLDFDNVRLECSVPSQASSATLISIGGINLDLNKKN